MTDSFSGQPQSNDHSPAVISQGIAVLHPDAIIPTWKVDSQEFRERFMKVMMDFASAINDYAKVADTIIIDERHGHLPGVFTEELSKATREKDAQEQAHVHQVVGSLKLPDREKRLKDYFRKAYEGNKIGNTVLIVSEYAISDKDKALTTLADAIREVGKEFGRNPEIRIAAVSVRERSSSQSERDGQEQYRWLFGEMGAPGQPRTMGLTAFYRDNITGTAAAPNSAAGILLPPEKAGTHFQQACEDMRNLARKFLELGVIKN